MTDAQGQQPDEADRSPGVMGGLKKGLQIWEVASGLIAVISTVVGFINANGGLVVILMTIGYLGFFAYITAWGVFFVVGFLIDAVEKAKREVTDQGALIAVGIIWFGLTALLVAWVGGIPTADDFADYDSLGQFTFAAMGTLVVLIPLGLLWYTKGTRPTQK